MMKSMVEPTETPNGDELEFEYEASDSDESTYFS